MDDFEGFVDLESDIKSCEESVGPMTITDFCKAMQKFCTMLKEAERKGEIVWVMGISDFGGLTDAERQGLGIQ